MVRITFQPEELRRAAERQQLIAERLRDLGQRLRADLDGRRFNFDDPDLARSGLYERFSATDGGLKAVADRVEVGAVELRAAADRAELADAPELGIGPFGSVEPANLIFTDYPPAPTSLLHELARTLADGGRIAPAGHGSATPTNPISLVEVGSWQAVSSDNRLRSLAGNLIESGLAGRIATTRRVPVQVENHIRSDGLLVWPGR